MEIWSKTILSVYKYLEAISKAIDNIIIKKSINSAFYNNGRFASTYECANEIINLTERKVNLINLKVLTEKTLMKLEPMQRKILTLTYIDNVSKEEVCNLLEISTRSYFRKRNEGIKSFVKHLTMQGYEKQKLINTFATENWLLNLYYKNCGQTPEDNYATVIKDDYKFIKHIIRKCEMASSAL